MSAMDRECVSLLPRMCEMLLVCERPLPDDTSLEKLLDWFTGLTQADDGGSLLEVHRCLCEFIAAVVKKTASDPAVISFTLKLSGLISATEDGFTLLQEHAILDLAFNHQHWHEAGLWEDPCVRIGWIQGLRSMLQHPKALCFFVQSGFIGPLLQLQTDSSLFVASAANQTLAHILLHFQPASTAECNGADKEHGDDIRSQATAAGVERSGVTTETSRDYAAVVVTILEHLRESVVPEENTQLHQSQQILRLLALVLAQAKAPLRNKLLRSVADSLDKLVTSGYSQLTRLLMDIVLAAYTTDVCDPSQCVTRLLSSMLNTDKPSDLVHAAAAFLRRGHLDSVHTARAVRILLLPLHIITGQTPLDPDSAVEEYRFSMAEHLTSKSSCISVICVCLTATPQITLTPPDLLPCPPVSVVTSILLLLRICGGDSSSSSSGCTEVLRNIIGSGKVQKCALEAMMGLTSSPGVKDKLIEVFAVLTQCLNNPDSDPTVIHKSYQALVKWMSLCGDVSSATDKLRKDLSDVVQKRVCDMRWEVRDSTVEFLGKLAGVLTSDGEEHDASQAFLSSCFTTPLLREALQDTESYVRASAITALAQTQARSWQQGAALTQEQVDIVRRLLEILSQDTEGFARRAVVQYFITWFSSCASHESPLSSTSSSSLLMSSVSSVLSHGSSDLDWEVKVHTLELAELLLNDALSRHRGYGKASATHMAVHPYASMLHTHSRNHVQGVGTDLAAVLTNLVEQGVVSTLLSSLVDCDRPVGLKACQLLMTLREMVCPLSPEALDATPAMATVARVSCELPACGWAREIRKILGAKQCDDVTAQRCGETGDGGDSVCVCVCEILRSLGLDARLDILSQSSDHVHNSPLSLLQDILTANAAQSHPDAQTAQEVIVDCY